MRMHMEITRTFTARCCVFGWTEDTEHELWERLLDHVDAEHPDVRDELERSGRLMARGNNGMGYFDSDHHDGWSKAGPMFRRTYRKMALQMRVQGHL